MAAHNLKAALEGLADLEFKQIARFNKGSIGIFKTAAGTSPWERHPDDDEYLHVLEGEVDITVLADHGPARTTVAAGSVFIVPRGLWHRHTIKDRLVELFVTPGETEHSTAEDPRHTP
jgi:uncharacterized cupin superfamily protein